jgi:hypothetical protein
MGLTYTEASDSRQNLGMSGIIQKDTLQPAAADYPEGGYPINPQNWGMGALHGLVQLEVTGTASEYVWQYVPAAPAAKTPSYAGNLIVYQSAANADAAAPLSQVPAGTDLSGGTVSFLAFGF